MRSACSCVVTPHRPELQPPDRGALGAADRRHRRRQFPAGLLPLRPGRSDRLARGDDALLGDLGGLPRVSAALYRGEHMVLDLFEPGAAGLLPRLVHIAVLLVHRRLLRSLVKGLPLAVRNGAKVSPGLHADVLALCRRPGRLRADAGQGRLLLMLTPPAGRAADRDEPSRDRSASSLPSCSSSACRSPSPSASPALVGCWRDFNLVIAPPRMFTGIDSFVLLAAPFYILAGEIMNRGGITDRLIRLVMLVVGRIRGGTAYACIVGGDLLLRHLRHGGRRRGRARARSSSRACPRRATARNSRRR